MSILVINAGSTSLKFGLFDAEARESLVSGSIDWADGNRQGARFLLRRGSREERSVVAVADDSAAATCAVRALTAEGDITVVGHRVVHGGTEFRNSTLIDDNVEATIAGLATLAPLHNPPALAAIRAVKSALPRVPQVAVFDTAFFARLPARAYMYAQPYEWYEKFGVRRIGFHGISNSYCVGRAVELLGRDPSKLRLVVCHLGGGCSATAVLGGEPVTTTMGFTPLDGLMMGTRSGSMDPGMLIHLLLHRGLTVNELDDALTHRSGLFGVSGVSSDLAQIESAASQGHQRAQLAFEMFADRVRSAIGALAVTMGGLDALVFTDRIGENSPAMRAAVCDGLECLRVQLDLERNATCRPDGDIAADASAVRILVIHTREELMIAREACRVLRAQPQPLSGVITG
ncbi:MAG: acetate/propionate family kinase [Verrucomicrobiia bacterium]